MHLFPFNGRIFLTSKQLRHLGPALVITFLQAHIRDRTRRHLEQITRLEHEGQAVTEIDRVEGRGGGFGEGDGVGAVRGHAAVQGRAARHEAFLGATLAVQTVVACEKIKDTN